MRKLLNAIFVIAMILPLGVMSQQNNMKNTPLIDREIFFDTPKISGGKLSPDGEWISFMKEYNGITNIWVKKSRQNQNQLDNQFI